MAVHGEPSHAIDGEAEFRSALLLRQKIAVSDFRRSLCPTHRPQCPTARLCLSKDEPLEREGDTVLLVRFRDFVCDLDYIGMRARDSDAVPSPFQHRNVIRHVAEGEHCAWFDPELFAERRERIRLCDPCRGYFDEFLA